MSITELEDIEPDALEDKNGEGTDYVLQEGVVSCWVEVDGIALYIRRTGSGRGVIVEAFESGDEMGETLDSLEVELI